MTWGPGSAEVDTLLEGGELERVTPDSDLAVRLLADSARHIESARSAAALGDLTGAYQLAYDALRKAAAALLAVQELRATSRGGHIAIQDAVRAQFGGPGSPFRSFGRIRRNRNAYEYPDSDEAGPDVGDVDDAVAVSRDALGRGGPALPGPGGGYLHAQNWRRAVHWSATSLGRRPHDLRHTTASLWIAARLDIKTVSSWLGHSTARLTLDTYGPLMGMDAPWEPTPTGPPRIGSTAHSRTPRAPAAGVALVLTTADGGSVGR